MTQRRDTRGSASGATVSSRQRAAGWRRGGAARDEEGGGQTETPKAVAGVRAGGMAKGPIRKARRTPRRPADLGPQPGLVKTTMGEAVSVMASAALKVVTPVDPQELTQRWARMETKALDVLDDGVSGRFEDPAHQRERRQAAEAILGVRRGGLPMPTIGGALRGVTAQERTIRLRWADGRPVLLPLHDPMQREPDDDD